MIYQEQGFSRQLWSDIQHVTWNTFRANYEFAGPVKLADDLFADVLFIDRLAVVLRGQLITEEAWE